MLKLQVIEEEKILPKITCKCHRCEMVFMGRRDIGWNDNGMLTIMIKRKSMIYDKKYDNTGVGRFVRGGGTIN